MGLVCLSHPTATVLNLNKFPTPGLAPQSPASRSALQGLGYKFPGLGVRVGHNLSPSQPSCGMMPWASSFPGLA